MRKIIFAAGMMSLLAACGNTGNTQTIAVDDTQNYDERKADSLGIPKGNKLSAAMKRAMKWEITTINGSLSIRWNHLKVILLMKRA